MTNIQLPPATPHQPSDTAKSTRTKRRLLAVFIVLSFIIPTYQSVLATNSAAPSNDDRFFGAWERWSTTLGLNTFNIEQCADTGSRDGRVQSADMNGDGLTDLACFYEYPNADPGLFVQLSTRNGYQPWSLWASLKPCFSFKLADIDADGDDDMLCVVTWANGDSAVEVTLSAENGSSSNFPVAFKTSSQFDLNRCAGFHIADINGDNREDLLCPYQYPTNNSTTFALVWDAQLGDTDWQQTSPTANGAQFRLDACIDFLVGDIDGNDRDDLLCTYVYPDGDATTFAQLASNDQFGAWQAWSSREVVAVSEGCVMQTMADVNGDGLADRLCIFLYPDGRTGIAVQRDKSDVPGYKYTRWLRVSELENTDDCTAFVVGNVNGDALDDVICTSRQLENSVTHVYEAERFTFADRRIWSPFRSNSILDIDRCFAMLAGDADGDGYTDLNCVYQYPSGSTATFVQRLERYQIFLPTIIK